VSAGQIKASGFLISLTKRPHHKRHTSLYSVEDAQRGDKAHPIHFLACMQKLVVLSSDIYVCC